MAGADEDMIDQVVNKLVEGGHVRIDIAQEIIKQLKEE